MSVATLRGRASPPQRRLSSSSPTKRFGFHAEGVFRQHLIINGLNRDTSWFAMIDKDWATLRPAYAAWRSPDNFDSNGQQKRRLEEFRTG